MGVEGGARESPANLDKAGTEYWDRSERNRSVELQRFGPAPGIRGYAKRAWHAAFVRALSSLRRKPRRLLELGCGGSAFLPYFSIEMGFEVAGVDYSEGGCELARQMCDAYGVNATLFCADFFEAPTALDGAFDAVVSFGVVEHFTDTTETVKKFASFLRPGGVIVTFVPNMAGSVGLLQRILARDVYDAHEVIDPRRLRLAHEAAGLEILELGYFLFMNFGVIGLSNHPGRGRRVLHTMLKAVTGIAWGIETVVGPLRPNQLTSPYLLCVARRPYVTGVRTQPPTVRELALDEI